MLGHHLGHLGLDLGDVRGRVIGTDGLGADADELLGRRIVQHPHVVLEHLLAGTVDVTVTLHAVTLDAGLVDQARAHRQGVVHPLDGLVVLLLENLALEADRVIALGAEELHAHAALRDHRVHRHREVVGVPELEVDARPDHRGIEAHGDVGRRPRVRGVLAVVEAGEERGGVERRADSAGPAADAVDQLTGLDDRRGLEAVALAALADGLIERHQLAGLDDPPVQLLGGHLEVEGTVGVVAVAGLEGAQHVRDVDVGQVLGRDLGRRVGQRHGDLGLAALQAVLSATSESITLTSTPCSSGRTLRCSRSSLASLETRSSFSLRGVITSVALAASTLMGSGRSSPGSFPEPASSALSWASSPAHSSAASLLASTSRRSSPATSTTLPASTVLALASRRWRRSPRPTLPPDFAAATGAPAMVRPSTRPADGVDW